MRPPPPPPTEMVLYVYGQQLVYSDLSNKDCSLKQWFGAWITFMNYLGVFRIHKT